ncbi:phenylacetate--CoA ligase family protein [Desulfobacter hydrogenophilus]|uniref:Phenylacetate--CoA ligase family protein n=1 Tax=Desulfobacter hydrogenophilus TaxID=2291 RepID=A0A328FFI7_9BACT|nr:AMP-binding protein [Desulfobacter hydrogenophilus]NDY70694.1 phenylacetate--CoA ligase family protein [Desulfobacter hydrogenophilus]QBH12690.1 phenylacetate--CoA ligase family protein [Desulfobacter hydrogenophilus]RAM03344.1 phenylacetate--CoA ligase family protein [Desulfobacter hydrogenophilus]
MNTPFLDTWMNRTMGLPSSPAAQLEAFGRHQLAALNCTITHARDHSRFYRDALSDIADIPLLDLKDMAALPFTRPTDIRENPKAFLALSQGEISRIVTLNTSGTTAAPKRIFFTDEDIGRVVDFFKAILTIIMNPGETGLIFLPGDTRASAGDLIRTAMEAAQARPVVPGIIRDFSPAADLVRATCPSLIIGMPVQVLALCEYMKSTGTLPNIPHVILTADHVPVALVERVEHLLDAKVLNHYGMTETGFGGAIQCPARGMLHIRHPDLFFEIVDPAGNPLPPGQWGEIVVTTLNRKGMPLVRYRTGDVSRILETPCACGSPFPRLDRVRNRQAVKAETAGRHDLTIVDLDDLLFSLPGVVDFTACIYTKINSRQAIPTLDIELMGLEPLTQPIYIDPGPSPGLTTALESGRLRMGSIAVRAFDFSNTYVTKRQIQFN